MPGVNAHRQPFSRRDLRRCGQDGKRLYLTLEEAAEHYGLARSTMLQWVQQGAIPHHLLGGRVYMNRVEVEAYWALFAGRK